MPTAETSLEAGISKRISGYPWHQTAPVTPYVGSPSFVISPFLRFVPDLCGRRVFVYHTLFGNPRVLNGAGLRFLRLFQSSKTVHQVRLEVEGDPAPLVRDFAQTLFVVPAGTDERALVAARRDELIARISAGHTIDHISLSISETCNFGCRHCMFFQPDSQGTPLLIYRKSPRALNMTWPTAKACVDTYLSLLTGRGESHARIHFGNAEPLMNWPVVEQVLDYCSSIPTFTFDFAINTNLSLLTLEMAQILKAREVRIATSLDGLGEANDGIRTTRTGKGTFDMIVAKMDLLESIGYPLDGISITVTAKNFELVDEGIIDFAADRGMTSLAFDYDLVDFSNVPVDRRVAKILRLKNYANSKAIYFGGTWYSPFRKIMTISLLDRPHAFCAAVEGRALVVNPDGSLKACGYTTSQVGHIYNLSAVLARGSGLGRLAAERFPATDRYCHGCMIEGPCGGQCHCTWEVARHSPTGLFEEMCIFYRSVTEGLIQDYLGVLDDPRQLQLRVRSL